MKKQLPNIFTLLNLFCGCIAIVLIMQNGIAASANENGEVMLMLPEKIYWASAFIGIAAIIDFLDGLVARWLNLASEMGKQLDSLADVVSFGVAPSMIIYQFLRIAFAHQEDGLDVSIVWLLPAFAVPCAGAYRLARYNLDKSQASYFKGVPIPAAGLLIASFPLIYWYAQSEMVINILLNQWFWYGFVIVVCALMVCRLPMMALKFKGFNAKKEMPKFILAVLSIAFGIFIKWLAVPAVFLVYVVLSIFMKKYVTNEPAGA